MIASTDFAGSHVVVFHGANQYLDARKDARQPGATFIEVVRNGQVYRRTSVLNEQAPETIVRIMREEFTTH